MPAIKRQAQRSVSQLHDLASRPCYLLHIQLFLVNGIIIRRLQKPSITLCLCCTHAPPTANIHFQNHHERSAQVRIPLPGPGTAWVSQTQFGSRIWAQTRVHAAQKQCRRIGPLRSSAYSADSKNKPRKRAPISTPQQLSSGLRYTHCDANLGNSHKSINLKPISKTPNMLLCFHSKA